MRPDRIISPFDSVSTAINEKEDLEKRKSAAKDFLDKAITLLYDYGPTKYVEVNWKYSDRVLPNEPISTPEVEFPTEDGLIKIKVTGENVNGFNRSKEGEKIVFGLSFLSNQNKEDFIIEFKNDKPVPEALPQLREIQNALKILEYIETDYIKRGVERHEESPDPDHR